MEKKHVLLSGFSDARRGLISLQHIRLITLFIPYGIMTHFRGDRRDPEAAWPRARPTAGLAAHSRPPGAGARHPADGQSWDPQLDQAPRAPETPRATHAPAPLVGRAGGQHASRAPTTAQRSQKLERLWSLLSAGALLTHSLQEGCHSRGAAPRPPWGPELPAPRHSLRGAVTAPGG